MANGSTGGGSSGNVSVDIKLATQQFEQALNSAKQKIHNFDAALSKITGSANKANQNFKNLGNQTNKLSRQTNKARNIAKSFDDRMKSLADTAALTTGPLGGVASRITVLNRVVQSGHVAFFAFSAAITAFGFSLRSAVNEAQKFETSGLRIQAVLKATGQASGLTSRGIRKLSNEIALSTLASVEGVEAAAAKLLTFRAVQGETFKEALKLSQDLAAVGFGSIESAVTQVGKALTDPINNLGALGRQGITFTPIQKDDIRTLQEAGKLFEAQEIVMQALRSQVDEVGKSMSIGLAGAYDTLSLRVSEFKQSLAADTDLLRIWTGLVNKLANAIDFLNKNILGFSDDPLVRLNNRLKELKETQEELIDPGLITRLTHSEDFRKHRLEFVNKEIKAIEAKIAAINKEENAAVGAAAKARKELEEEARMAKILEMQRKERIRLANARRIGKRQLEEEGVALTNLLNVFKDSNIPIQQFNNERERTTLLSRLQLDANSKEGKVINDLVNEKQKLNRQISHELSLKSIAADNKRAIRSIEIEINATRMLASSIGTTAEKTREITAEAERYRMEQEMIADIVREVGFVTDEQRAAITAASVQYSEAAARLAEIEQIQDKVRETTERFQDSLSQGFTDAIFGAKSLKDAMRDVILEISAAIVKAQILKTLQTSGFGAAFGGGIATATMHTGGIVGTSTNTRPAPVSTFISAPKFHNGLRPDEFPAILQRGEEVVPKNEVKSRSRSRKEITYNVNITTPDADSFRMSKRQISRQLRRSTAIA